MNNVINHNFGKTTIKEVLEGFLQQDEDGLLERIFVVGVYEGGEVDFGFNDQDILSTFGLLDVAKHNLMVYMAVVQDDEA